MTARFGAKSTTDEVLAGVDLSGKRILVTGVSAGLGVETARALAAHGAWVVGAARNLDKAKAATEEVRAQAANGGGLELVELDLASLASVRACAGRLLEAGKPFDLVIANAGVMACPKGQTSNRLARSIGAAAGELRGGTEISGAEPRAGGGTVGGPPPVRRNGARGRLVGRVSRPGTGRVGTPGACR